MRHFLVDPADVGEERVTIKGPDAGHISRVLRLRPDDEIVVSAVEKGRYRCSITETGKDFVHARIVERLEEPETSLPKMTLAQAVPKGRKMDDIVRMACELGAARIIPVVTERCVMRFDDASTVKKAERWRQIASAAAKQSRSISVAEVGYPVDIQTVAGEARESLKMVLWEENAKSLKEVLKDAPEPDSILVLIGPEGGFTIGEIDLLKNHGFEVASFGAKILRTETAGAVALGILGYHYSH